MCSFLNENLNEKRSVLWYDKTGHLVADWGMTYEKGLRFAFEYLNTPPPEQIGIDHHVVHPWRSEAKRS